MSVVLISKYLGVILSVLGLGYLLNPKHVPQMLDEIKSNVTLMMLSGIIGIIFGLTIILHAPLTAAGVPLLVAILGYVILAEGVLTLLFPSLYFSIVEFVIEKISVRIFSIIVFLLGLVLVYHSFFQ
jgi:hypothetical protein